jgi:hypothetical protein
MLIIMGCALNGWRSAMEAEVFLTKVACVLIPDEKREGVERSEGVIGTQQLYEFIIYAFDFLLGMKTPILAKYTLIATSGADAPKDSEPNEEGVTDALHGCKRME